MIKRDITATDLKDYYKQLYDMQSKRHGADYMIVHREIGRRLKDCDSYAELGIQQGTTLALA